MPPLHCATLANNYAVLRYLIEQNYPYFSDPDSESDVSCCTYVLEDSVWGGWYFCVNVCLCECWVSLSLTLSYVCCAYVYMGFCLSLGMSVRPCTYVHIHVCAVCTCLSIGIIAI